MALTNTQFQNIMHEYEKKRRENRLLLEERQKEIYQKIPEFHALDNSVSSAVSLLLSRLSADPKASE